VRTRARAAVIVLILAIPGNFTRIAEAEVNVIAITAMFAQIRVTECSPGGVISRRLPDFAHCECATAYAGIYDNDN